LFRISRRPDDPDEVFGNIDYGRVLILINRGDYFQAGLIVQKGSFEQLKSAGLESFREIVRKIAPYLGDRVQELQDWDRIKLLTVQINRVKKKWYRPGLLCIGDAAHAMSPAGGVGINLAIQDAVAAANRLAAPLRDQRLQEADLAAVQRRRSFPTKFTQGLQIFAHRGFKQIFKNTGPAQAPWQLKVALQIPGFQRVLGFVVGIGVRPEHIADSPRSPAFAGGTLKRIALGLAGIAVGMFILRKRSLRLAR
jgi:2-polyprenyl-6-methoxyphenol hydroxylase-like FAD-dependent oxidoreductase